MHRVVRKPYDEWVVYRDEFRRDIEDGRYLIFTLVAHRWDFLPDADGEKHYSCYIREYEDEDDSLANEYWRGFKISEDVRTRHYEQSADFFETFEEGKGRLLGEQSGFVIDEQTQHKYEEFITEFCSNIHCRDLYNLRHDFTYIRTDEIDKLLYEVIIILNEIGVKTHCSCQGTDENWTDFPCPIKRHSGLAYISVEELPDKLRERIEDDNRLSVRDNCISTVKWVYNKNFSEILIDAVEEIYPGSKAIPEQIMMTKSVYVLEQGCDG